MSNDKKTDFEAKKNALLEKREENAQNKENLKKLVLSFGAIAVLSSGVSLEAEAQNTKDDRPTKKKPEKTTMYDAAKDSISARKKLKEKTNDFEDFDKLLEDMDNSFNDRIKKMDKKFNEKIEQMDKEFNEQTKEMDSDFEKAAQKPGATRQSMLMKGGLIVSIEDQNGNNVPFKKDIENDYTTRNVLDQIIRGKMDADSRYDQSWVMEDVAEMVYNLNNNPAEFDKNVNRQMKGVKSRTEKDGSVSFLYVNKKGENHRVANFSKEVAEKNPAIKRIRANEAITQKSMEQGRTGK